MEYRHFTHTHGLDFHQLHPGSEIQCSACKISAAGNVYACWRCNYFLHERCFNAARSLKTSIHLLHPLTLMPYPTHQSSSFYCNSCNLIGTGMSYCCAACDFDLHIHCADLLPYNPTTYLPSHGDSTVPPSFSVPFPPQNHHFNAGDLNGIPGYPTPPPPPTAPFLHSDPLPSFQPLPPSCPPIANLPPPIPNQPNPAPPPPTAPFLHSDPLPSFQPLPPACPPIVTPPPPISSQPNPAPPPPTAPFLHSDPHPSFQPLPPACPSISNPPPPLSSQPNPSPPQFSQPNPTPPPQSNQPNPDPPIYTPPISSIIVIPSQPTISLPENNSPASSQSSSLSPTTPPVSQPNSDKPKPPSLIKHFSHPHVLLPMELDKKNAKICSACECSLFGSAYCCTEGSCTFNLHKTCFDSAIEVRHKCHLDHPLKLLTAPPYDDGFTCNACLKQGKAFTYHCEECSYDLHIDCITWPETVTLTNHKHDLNLYYSSPAGSSDQESVFPCEVCNNPIHDMAWLYYCRECDYGTHLECVAAGLLPAADDEQTEEDLLRETQLRFAVLQLLLSGVGK